MRKQIFEKFVFFGGVDPGGTPENFFGVSEFVFLDQHWKKSILEKFSWEGAGTPSAPEFGDPLIFQLGIDI